MKSECEHINFSTFFSQKEKHDLIKVSFTQIGCPRQPLVQTKFLTSNQTSITINFEINSIQKDQRSKLLQAPRIIESKTITSDSILKETCRAKTTAAASWSNPAIKSQEKQKHSGAKVHGMKYKRQLRDHPSNTATIVNNTFDYGPDSQLIYTQDSQNHDIVQLLGIISEFALSICKKFSSCSMRKTRW